MRSRTIDTPIGPVTLAGGDRLRHVVMAGQTHEPDDRGWRNDPSAFSEVVDQLDAYFAGDLEEFDVDIELIGTEFQQAVWHGLRDIPYGETWSYGQLAHHIGRRPPCGPWGWPTAATRSRSSSRATGSSARTAP